MYGTIKTTLLLACLFLGQAFLVAQNVSLDAYSPAALGFDLRFLSSDELMGRRTGSPGNQIAARFIAERLMQYGYKPAPGMDGYFQSVPFEEKTGVATSSLIIAKEVYQPKEDFILISGVAGNYDKKQIVFAGHGWVDTEAGIDDYKDLDVKGKIVLVLPGKKEDNSQKAIFEGMQKKKNWAEERGAVALLEIYRMPFPWQFFVNYFGGSTINLAPDTPTASTGKIPYGFVKEKKDNENLKSITEAKKVNAKASIRTSGTSSRSFTSPNVLGVLEGSDPMLKDEYVVLSAHFDHVGTGKDGGAAFTPEDSIFNGARDNAMGVVALLHAAELVAASNPRRSVIVLAVTGEEIGLLGSSYYAEHPAIPLNKVVFNLNTDGAGYNDMEYVSVFGFGRTGTDSLIQHAAESVGLKVFADPAPEQNLFDRSDNVSFAKKGVPALTFSPGLTEFGEAIFKNYHQVSDEWETIDMDYFVKYCKAYGELAKQLMNWSEKPVWKSGDKYEKAAIKLYSTN